MEVFETCFYDILTTRYDHQRYVFRPYLRVFHSIWVLGPGGGGGGGGSQGLGAQPAYAVFGGTSKIKVLETCFCDIVITCNDHPRYVKHVLGRICVIFTPFGYYV